jgi:phosphate uptake regulator
MKRKVINISGNTMMVTLPSKWVAKLGIKKGDELDIEEKENDLVVSTDAARPTKKKEYSVDIKNHIRTGGRYIVGLYRLGYDTMVIHYEDSDYLGKIPKEISENTIGMEIISQKKNSCVIKNLSVTKEQGLEDMIKRIWFLLLDMAKDIREALDKDDRETLKTIYLREKNVNKFSNYILRIIMQNTIMPADASHTLYFFIRYFENASDDLEIIASYYSEEKDRASEQFVKTFLSAVELLDSFYDLYYSYSDQKSESIILTCERLIKDIKSIDAGKHQLPLFSLHNMVSKVKRLVSTIIEMNILRLS